MLADALHRLGFTVTRLRYGDDREPVRPARHGAPHFCFAGHTDVVPVGAAQWRHDPFGAEVRDGVLYGRGACDMKGGIAAFVAGVAQHLADGQPQGSISLLITGDEEGDATDGTVRVLDWMQPARPDSRFLPGRRADLPGAARRHDQDRPPRQPEREDHGARHARPRRLSASCRQPGAPPGPRRAALTAAPLDAGTDWFEPSTLQLTSLDVGNTATNVIPAAARATLNIRFNDRHTGASLSAWLRAVLAQHAERFDLDIAISGESFLTEPGAVDTLRRAIVDATGVEPKLDTGGGTSDARFIARYCPVAEFGLVGASMHQADERVPVAELRALAGIYRRHACAGRACALSGTHGRAADARIAAPCTGRATRDIMLGIFRIARGRADGLAQFGGTRRGLPASLAPLVAFPLVGALLMLLGGGGAGRADRSAGDAVRAAGARRCCRSRWRAVGPRRRRGYASRPRSTGASGRSRCWRPAGGAGGDPADRPACRAASRPWRWSWGACAATACGCTGSWRAMGLACRGHAPALLVVGVNLAHGTAGAGPAPAGAGVRRRTDPA